MSETEISDVQRRLAEALADFLPTKIKDTVIDNTGG